MFPGWISLRVHNPEAVGKWHAEHLGLVVFGGRKDFGSVALGTGDHGAAIILLPGDPLEHPERLGQARRTRVWTRTSPGGTVLPKVSAAWRLHARHTGIRPRGRPTRVGRQS